MPIQKTDARLWFKDKEEEVRFITPYIKIGSLR
jgi:hypothetical protein